MSNNVETKHEELQRIKHMGSFKMQLHLFYLKIWYLIYFNMIIIYLLLSWELLCILLVQKPSC